MSRVLLKSQYLEVPINLLLLQAVDKKKYNEKQKELSGKDQI